MIPQIKEFDRLSTTVINSYVGPVFSRYLSHLGERFEAYPQLRDVLIMQSNGGVAPIADSSRMAVRGDPVRSGGGRQRRSVHRAVAGGAPSHCLRHGWD